MIKNPASKTSVALFRVRARWRIALTGTPIQNNLREMWALFNWTHSGTLLGIQKSFNDIYDKPITRGREKDATNFQKKQGEMKAKDLFRKINPFYLHRSKDEVTARENLRPDDDCSLVPRYRKIMPKFLTNQKTLHLKNASIIKKN